MTFISCNSVLQFISLQRKESLGNHAGPCWLGKRKKEKKTTKKTPKPKICSLAYHLLAHVCQPNKGITSLYWCGKLPHSRKQGHWVWRGMGEPDSSLIHKDALSKKVICPASSLLQLLLSGAVLLQESCVFIWRCFRYFSLGIPRNILSYLRGWLLLVVAWLGGAHMVCSGVGRVP